jgi:hypothetical protein
MCTRFNLYRLTDMGYQRWPHKEICHALGQQFYFVINVSLYCPDLDTTSCRSSGWERMYPFFSLSVKKNPISVWRTSAIVCKAGIEGMVKLFIKFWLNTASDSRQDNSSRFVQASRDSRRPLLSAYIFPARSLISTKIIRTLGPYIWYFAFLCQKNKIQSNHNSQKTNNKWFDKLTTSSPWARSKGKS